MMAEAPYILSSFRIRLCQPILQPPVCHDSSGALIQTQVCETDLRSGVMMSAGNALVNGTDSAGRLVVNFTGGADCGDGQTKETTLVFECNPGSQNLIAELVYADQCRRIFRLQSGIGCRVCSSAWNVGNPDYSVQVSECVNNVKNMTFVRRFRQFLLRMVAVLTFSFVQCSLLWSELSRCEHVV